MVCLHEISTDESADGSSQFQTLLVAAQKIEQPADIPAIAQLFSIVESELVAAIAGALCLAAERRIDRTGERVVSGSISSGSNEFGCVLIVAAGETETEINRAFQSGPELPLRRSNANDVDLRHFD